MLTGTQYRCDSDKRREAVIASALANGIDYLEVLDNWAKTSPDSPRQRTLLVHLFKKPTVPLDASNVVISGGARITVDVEWAYVYGAFPPGTLHPDEQALLDGLPDRERVLVVRTTTSGDFSQYQLALVRSADDRRPPPSFDPKLAAVELFFKVECATDFDCATTVDCPPAVSVEPEIDYLAKDYTSFRRLMLERLSAIMPDWNERNPADVGMVLVEVVAYVADQLSYYQDAVATEAYLGTARMRVSVRRHARLLDYTIDDGANARAWVAIRWGGASSFPLGRDQVRFFTRVPELATVARHEGDAIAAANAGGVGFEPMEDVVLDAGLNQVLLYTWGDDRCCLPKGATSATLDNTGGIRLATLKKGAVLVLGEVLSPETALPEDADPAHRQAVRITSVEASTDPLFFEPDGTTPQRVVEVTWAAEDALQFPLCVWRVAPIATNHKGRVTLSKPATFPIVVRIAAIDAARQATAVEWSQDGGLASTFESAAVTAGSFTGTDTKITFAFTPPFTVGETFAFGPASVAWGNIVLVDHGSSITEVLPPVLEGETYRPRLQRGPVTQAATYAAASAPTSTPTPAAAAFEWQARDVFPQVTITFPQEPGVVWNRTRDLLEADPFEHAVVVETEDDGRAYLRFGDGTAGRQPDATPVDTTMQPRAQYRIGNGVAGNVGAEAIAHAVFEPAVGTAFDQIELVRNPLPASGGREPETIDEVKLYAPQAFRTQERAVTVDDYARIAERHPEVLKAVASRRWTGSWYTIFLSVDRRGGLPIDDAFEATLRDFLDDYRLAGQDVEIEQPAFVPLNIVLAVCIEDGYYRADVKRALLAAFSNRDLPDGSRGFFHPDNFTFGQPVYLSQLVTAAMRVPGVKWIDLSPGHSVFRRFWDGPIDLDLEDGKLDMSRLEVARLDNDPNFPENGKIDFALMGGL